MLKRWSQIIFIIVFLLMIAVPLAAMFFQHEIMDVDENRRLAEPAKLVDEEGQLNTAFLTDYERWLNDHIGFRKLFVQLHGRFHYYVYHKFTPDIQYVLGPNEELIYSRAGMFRDYQHRNLYPEAYLKTAAESLQTIKDIADEKGIAFYYYQCWDKHSIYPEYVSSEILQYGDHSKTDEIIRALNEYTDIPVISPKEELLRAKETGAPYSVFGDPTHWAPEGGIIGYRVLMERINEDATQPFPVLSDSANEDATQLPFPVLSDSANEDTTQPFPVLSDSNYKITQKDEGLILFGTIHKVCMVTQYKIREPKAVLTNDKLSLFADDPHSFYYTNNSVDNKTRLLIVGDSFFQYYILKDIAESFHETVFIHGGYMADIEKLMDAYEPDILLIENAEREDRTALWIQAANPTVNDAPAEWFVGE